MVQYTYQPTNLPTNQATRMTRSTFLAGSGLWSVLWVGEGVMLGGASSREGEG